MNSMTEAADVPIQKVLGTAADTCGTMSLLFTLLIFHNNCVYPLIAAFHGAQLIPRFWTGPGVYCYGMSLYYYLELISHL